MNVREKLFHFMHEYFIVFPHTTDTHTQHVDMLYQLVNKTLEARLFYLLLHQFAQLFMNLSIRYCSMMMMMMMMKWALLLFLFHTPFFVVFRDMIKNYIFVTCQWLLTLLSLLYAGGDLVKYALAMCAVWFLLGEHLRIFTHLFFREICMGMIKKRFFCVKMLIIYR